MDSNHRQNIVGWPGHAQRARAHENITEHWKKNKTSPNGTLEKEQHEGEQRGRRGDEGERGRQCWTKSSLSVCK